MRIGIMLRAYDRPGGIGIYCRNIVKHLLAHDSVNDYVLLYNTEDHLGKYAHLPNVQEVYIPGGNPIVWDQISIPRAVKAYKIDLLFNTKFSLPFVCAARKIMVLHGASWFVKPELYKWYDILYVKMMMPLYCRIADFLISNSDLTTRDFKQIVKVPEEKIQTVLLAPGANFSMIDDADILETVRQKYSLPEKFFLTVTSYDPRKNFSGLADSFEKCCKDHPDIHLVVIGKNCHLYGPDYNLKERGLASSVIFPGWVEQDDLPAIYNLARGFVFPSVYEEFGIPVVEAMACGCPIISSTTGAIPELTRGAALLCDPEDTGKRTQYMNQLLEDENISRELVAAGLVQAKRFSWDEGAKMTLKIFDTVISS